MTFSEELAAVYRRDLTRLIQEIQAFPDDATLWETRPGATNSAGNLAMHLEGNLREYVGRLLGGIAYQRQRPLEFSGKDLTRAELVERLEAVKEMVPAVLAALTEEQLDSTYPENVLGSPLTSRQYLLHTFGHFSYHLGQIDYLRRVLTGEGALRLASL